MSLLRTIFTRRKRVLFVCRGNAIRSQMAEALAQQMAGDVMDAASAGIRPAHRISRRAVAALAENGIVLDGTRPTRSIKELDLNQFELIVNLSDVPLPGEDKLGEDTVVLRIPLNDPMKQGPKEFAVLRDQLMWLVTMLAGAARREMGFRDERDPTQTSLLPAPTVLPRPSASRSCAA
jgi:arsenate reductase (thioredoxin)